MGKFGKRAQLRAEVEIKEYQTRGIALYENSLSGKPTNSIVPLLNF